MSTIAHAASRPPTVYLIEDDADLRESLAALLEGSGYLPRPFASAEDFLAKGAYERPACAVVDLRLPGMSGLDLQKKLHDEQPHLPVIVVTGHGDVATARTALRTGALDFLEKPVQPQVDDCAGRPIGRAAGQKVLRAGGAARAGAGVF
jgi:FixJ family two-component response regulator